MRLFWTAVWALVSPVAAACAVTPLVSNSMCAPEMTAAAEVSLPIVEGGEETTYAVLQHEGIESWRMLAVGPLSAIENPHIHYVPQYRSWLCGDYLYVPYVAMPSGEPVRNIVLRRDAVNWLRWRVQPSAVYPASNPCI